MMVEKDETRIEMIQVLQNYSYEDIWGIADACREGLSQRGNSPCPIIAVYFLMNLVVNEAFPSDNLRK